MNKLLLAASLFLSVSAHAARQPLCSGFLPENTMYIPVQEGPAALATGITQAQFNSALTRLYNEYKRDVSANGGSLFIEKKWSDGTVNAYAYRDKQYWIITMFGGMARHPAMTYDGFVAVACHEMGHHLGGAPLFAGDPWASVEGQSDYFATLKCVRRIFRYDDNEKILAGRRLDPAVVSQCQSEHRGRQDQLLCIRAGMAGISLASVMAWLENGSVPKVTTPDIRRVSRTYEDHPRAQCRLDTYFQGALCRVPWAQSVNMNDYRPGTCADARTYVRGLRPRCWFAP